MSKLHIENIRITYQGHDLSQYGLFPLLAWYLMDVIKLPKYFEQVTVNCREAAIVEKRFCGYWMM